jgi:hypothetical protein
MGNQELQKLLEQLHREIEHTPAVDPKGRELLRDLNTDITDLIERSEGDVKGPNAFTIQSLENSIEHFEVTHPTLTEILSRFLTILSNSGI